MAACPSAIRTSGHSTSISFGPVGKRGAGAVAALKAIRLPSVEPMPPSVGAPPQAASQEFEAFAAQRGSKNVRTKAQKEQLFREFEVWRAKQGGAR
jgi:hypothetical protein